MESKEKSKEQHITKFADSYQNITKSPVPQTNRNRPQVAIVNNRTWIVVAFGFGIVCILSWLNEILDLPHFLMGAARTPFNWPESIIEIILITIVGLFTVLVLKRNIAENKKKGELLQRYHDELEIMVKEQTAELLRVNEELRINITERKKAEEALRESEERYRTLVHNVPVAVYRTTPGHKGKFLMGNPTCLKMFGFDSEEELKKISVADTYTNPEERKVFSDNLLAKGSVNGVKLQLRKKDGTPFWGSVTARVVYDKNGKNPCFDCTVVDITERKRAEKELKKKMHDLETFQKVAVERELKMVELKKEIKELKASLVKK